MMNDFRIGNKWNRLTLTEITNERSDLKIVGIFKCDCGKTHKTTISRVKRGIIKSCGCMTGKFRLGKNYEWKIGQKFGKFELLEIMEKKNENGCYIGKIKCSVCRKTRVVPISYISKECDIIKCCNDDITGKIFGKLTAIEKIDKGHYYICKCECGNLKKITRRQLYKTTHKIKACKNCMSKEPYKVTPAFEEITGGYWYSIKYGASARNLEFELTQEDAWNLYLKQNKKCALTGLDIKFGIFHKGDQTCSLDRIDNSKGYTIDNVQWVHKDINRMRGTLTIDSFIKYCQAVNNHLCPQL